MGGILIDSDIIIDYSRENLQAAIFFGTRTEAGLTLYTNNVKHFTMIEGLKVVEPY